MIINNNKKAERANNLIYWLVLGIILILVVYVRIRLLDIPLERDEGEYAYCAQLVLQMVLPFKVIYTMKLPGTCFAYSLLMLIFGQTTQGIHLGLLLVNCLSLAFMFLITRRLLNTRAAIIATLTYAVLSVSPTVLGFAAHATHFLVAAALGGTFLLLLALENRKLSCYGAGGFILGLAFIMKQPGIFFILWGGFLILYAGLTSRPLSLKLLVTRLCAFGAGAVLPLMAVLLMAWLSGSFGKFWFWTVQYSGAYASSLSFSRGFNNFMTIFPLVTKGFEPVWILALLGILSLLLDKRFAGVKWPLLAFTLFSVLAVCLGLYFRPHYFIVLLPALSLLVSVFADTLQHYLTRESSQIFWSNIPLLVVAVAIILGINAHKNYFFFEKPRAISREIYGANPFSESVEIAAFLKSKTNPGDKIAVLGSEPQIFFYAQRRSATGYIYTYGLMEPHKYHRAMQREMIGEIEQSSPKYLIFINIISSWLPQAESDRHIFKWLQDYSRKYYNLVGMVDLISSRSTRYLWGDMARSAKNESPFTILIYERKPAAGLGGPAAAPQF